MYDKTTWCYSVTFKHVNLLVYHVSIKYSSMHGHGTQRFSVIHDASKIILFDCVQQQLSLTKGPSKIRE
jgi:hypothetical protein